MQGVSSRYRIYFVPGALILAAILIAIGATVSNSSESDQSDAEEAKAIQSALQAESEEAVQNLTPVKAPPNVIADLTPEQLDQEVSDCKEQGSESDICRIYIQIDQGDMEPGEYTESKLDASLERAEADDQE